MMPSLTPLGDAVRDDGGILQTGPFGTQLKQAEYSDDGVPVIMPKDIRNGEVVTETVARVPEATADRLARHRIAENGIVLPRRGEVTKRAFIRSEEAGWLCGTGCLKIETKGNRIWPKYLYYYMGTPASVDWLEKNAVGSTMLNLSAEIVSRFPIRLPSLREQERIADILSAYDDLIETNRRRVALLEETARLLYREWFVHFRFPGHEHVPFTDGLPEGWERRKLGEVMETNCESYRTKELPDEIDYIDISSVAQGRVVSKARMPAADAPGRARRKVRDGDVIWSNVRPNLRAYALILNPDDLDVVSTGFTVLSASSVPFTWLYMFVTTDGFVGHLINHATGAGYPAVRPDDFERAELVLPPKSLLDFFHEATEPSFRLITIVDQQNRKLAEARDLLLPRLMNGEIAV
ncbi:restriction endonuclease subunit S [Rubellimicrobium arenae]|uniref:restriction endonuclease subunit S n=1 Tax=Rubellimicrobium arenae TaxID=2817372 RepID=UPI001B30C073|nr:restriction endonuclease subunit S [Rubellimicrobium arenae]